MVDGKKSKIDLKKKYGPLTGTGWLLTGGGVAAAWYIYSKIKAGSAASAAAPSSVLTGSNSIPGGNTVTSATPNGATYSTLSEWENAAIAAMTGSGVAATDAYNNLQAWMGGSCVDSASYSALGSVISSQGLPPGFGSTMPILTICPSTTSVSGSSSSGSGSGGTTSSGSSGSTTPSAPTPTASSNPVTNLVQAVSQTTGLPMPGFMVNPSTGQTMTAGSGYTQPTQTSNASAPNFNVYQPLSLQQAQQTYSNTYNSLIAAGFTPANARAQAAGSTNVQGYQNATVSQLETLLGG